jgi:hypothetical protein
MRTANVRPSGATVPRVHGIYLLATGLWPIVHLRSFERVVGPKIDRWLVKTFGALVAAVGASFVMESLERTNGRTVRTLALTSAGVIALAELIYVSKGRISPVYLLDVVAQLGLIVGWKKTQAARCRMKNKGKPSRQEADERKEREVTDPSSPRTIHRFDRSRSDEKGGRGELGARRSLETVESKRQRKR